jgi:hypothetical protein
MDKPLEAYWALRLSAVAERLAANNFEVHLAADLGSARDHVWSAVIGPMTPCTVSFGGSATLAGSGLVEAVRADPKLTVIDTFDKAVTRETILARRREALHADLLLTGTNAITANGQLVNLDMIGNRTGAISFGPRKVVILAGRNKLVADLDTAFRRVKELAAPVNAMRLDKKTPCVKTGVCHDCASPERICNVWSVVEKAYPKGRIRVVLINADLGF